MILKKIVLHSVPRSGSTWLGSMLDSSSKTIYRYQPLFSYTHKSQLSQFSSIKDINLFFEDIKNTSDKFVLQEEAIKKGLVPKFNKGNPTHIVYKEVRYHHILENLLIQDNDINVIGLVRSPFSVINSWLQAPKEFKSELGWKVEEEWKKAPSKNLERIEEYNGYEKWKEVTNLFLNLEKKFPNRFHLVNYSNLVSNKMETLKGIFDFCNLPFSEQTQDFLKKSSRKNNEDAYAVYKTKNNDLSWKKTLPTYIVDSIKSDKEFQELNKIFRWSI